LVAALALIARVALDGLATRARSAALTVAPERFLLSVSELGSPVALAAAVMILFACGLVTRRARLTRGAVVLAPALVGTALVVLSLKWLAGRGPDGMFYGFGTGDGRILFPSGHTAMAFAACAVIGAAWRKLRWPGYGIAVGVAISRVTLIHFLSDVVAGALIGVIVGRLVTDWAVSKDFLTLDSGPRATPATDPASPPAKR
jgi:membrane-associated phospholipid phosphatase